MCGIVGIAGRNAFSPRDILLPLKRLEYRGYDSFGFATDSGILKKQVGEVRTDFKGKCRAAISHTRWATHGGISKKNAHPHADCTGSLFVVHNGIIENYAEMKSNLQKKHKFSSQTDSEIIAHYFEEKLKTKDMIPAMKDFLAQAKGTFAILIMRKNENTIYALKKDSPLVLGISDGKNFIASDIYAFSDKTRRAVFFDDNEFAVITPENFTFYDRKGKQIKKKEALVPKPEQPAQKKFPHYMIKEINDQPASSKRLLDSLETAQKNKVSELVSLIRRSGKIIFLASGTSYHACLLGVYFLHKAGIDAQAIIASEFRDYAAIDENSLVIAVSQSGETMDVIDALKVAKEKKAKIASFVNTPFSTIQRMSDLSLQIQAGQEICVAATKSFTNQVALLLCLANRLGYDCDREKIPDKISLLLKEEKKIQQLAKSLCNEKDIYIIGRGSSYPVAREIALKLKEISYIHAEGMMGGELKHGTLALIEKGTPVIVLMNGSDIVSNVKEAQARGADIIAIAGKKTEYEKEIIIPAETGAEFCILSNIAGQLLTYHIAKEKGLPIDRPRNLAKSVTVK
jgi:glucosamine--fructose-6-phosphate aminotransferase (isomerizing)